MLNKLLGASKIAFLLACCGTSIFPSYGTLLLKVGAVLFISVWLIEAVKEER